MRKFCVFFSLLILILGILPCADTDLTKNNADSEVSSDNGTNSGHENDLCSPFCQCACCTSPILTYTQEYSLIKAFIELRTYSVHLPGEVIEKPFSIFQPPKLS